MAAFKAGARMIVTAQEQHSAQDAQPDPQRSVMLFGHKTSISLVWQALRKIARERGMSTSALVH
jgi:predicted DNA-binding ribbon-helix-helix protein